MDKFNLREKIYNHDLWLKRRPGGVCADFGGLDLAGADLRRLDLRGASFAEADLSHANLSGAKLDGADLFGARLDFAILRQTALDGADLRGASLNNCDLTEASLAGAVLRRGLRMAQAGEGPVQVVPVQLREAVLEGTDMSNADALGADMTGARMADVILRGANLTGADLSGADLSNATLDQAEMTDALMLDTCMTGVDLDNVDMRRAARIAPGGADQGLVDQVGSHSRWLADGDGAPLKLEGADLAGADLAGLDLSGAVMLRARLCGANLRGTRLVLANLEGCDLRRTASRAGKAAAPREVQMDVEPLGARVERAARHHPRRHQPQRHLKQVRVPHRSAPLRPNCAECAAALDAYGMWSLDPIGGNFLAFSIFMTFFMLYDNLKWNTYDSGEGALKAILGEKSPESFVYVSSGKNLSVERFLTHLKKDRKIDLARIVGNFSADELGSRPCTEATDKRDHRGQFFRDL
ncbi:MAG: pentapeptide repeat-containing protein [Alphaproteobacteria bacterium]|nr:pentapeptide repeat-containing protein [Alphaproteobacteria bacterium]